MLGEECTEVLEKCQEVLEKCQEVLEKCQEYIKSVADDELYSDHDHANIDLLDEVENCLGYTKRGDKMLRDNEAIVLRKLKVT